MRNEKDAVQEIEEGAIEEPAIEESFFLSALERQPSDAYEDMLTIQQSIADDAITNGTVISETEALPIDPAVLPPTNTSNTTCGDGPDDGSQGVLGAESLPTDERPEKSDIDGSWNEYLRQKTTGGLPGLVAAVLPLARELSRRRKRKPRAEKEQVKKRRKIWLWFCVSPRPAPNHNPA